MEWPSSEMVTEFSSMIRIKEPSFLDVFGFVDGLNPLIQNHLIASCRMLTTTAGSFSAFESDLGLGP